MRGFSGLVLLSVAMVACGGQEDGSLHSPAAGDPNDPHYKRAGDPITFIHIVDDGREVGAEISVGAGDGKTLDMPEGWSFVITMGAETKPATSGKTLFRDIVGKSDLVTVELHRPDRAPSVFAVVPPPTFEEPKVSAKSVAIGSSVSVEMSAVDFPQLSFDCENEKPCTWISVSADGTCVSWESSVHFIGESPFSFRSPRTVEVPIVASELSDGPCSGKVEMRTSTSQDWPDGRIYFGRTRGPSVAFTR